MSTLSMSSKGIFIVYFGYMLIKSPTDFASYAVTDNIVFRNKEELEANNLTWKQANKGVTLKCKAIYLELIK